MGAIKALAIGCIFATAATPLAICTHFYFPFIEPKAIYFRVLVELALAAYLVLGIANRAPRLAPSPILFALGAVLIVMAVADVMAPIPFMAFLSRYERMEGYVCLAHVAAFIFVAASVLDSEKLRRRFLGAHVIASAGVGIMGLFSYGSYVLAGRATAPVYSTLGNQVFLGQYAALTCCFAAYLMVEATPRARRWLLAALALNMAMVFLSQGRMAALALLLGGAVGVLTIGSHAHRRLLLGATVGAAVLLVLVPMTIQAVPRIHRFIDPDFPNDPRLIIWRVAVQAIWARPWFGWGQEGLLVGGGYVHASDRAHNLVLDWLVAGGVFGGAAFAWLLLALRSGIKTVFAGAERAALYAFLAVYIATDMVLFDTLTTYIALGTVLAITVARQTEAWKPQEHFQALTVMA